MTPALKDWCSALRETGVESNVLAAAGRFRGLPWSALEAHHLSSSLGAADLSAAAAPVELGDAFISHSWSDDGDAKFMALSRWAAEFEKQAGREPTLWLDKACIDQDIDASLLGLPIYVSGCTRLLVLDGPTYSTRLWCIMDILLCRPRQLAERHRGAAARGADAKAQGPSGVPRARRPSVSSAPCTTSQYAWRGEIRHASIRPRPPRGGRGGAQLLRAESSLLPRERPRAAAERDRSGVRRHRAIRCSGAQPARLERSRAEQRPQRRQRREGPSRCEWQRWGWREKPAPMGHLHRALLLPRHARLRLGSARRVEAAGAGGSRRALRDVRRDLATQ